MKGKKESTVEFRSARLKISAYYPKSLADKMEEDLKNDGWYRVPDVEPEPEINSKTPNPEK